MSESATANGMKTKSHLEELDMVPKEEKASSKLLKPLPERPRINEKMLDSPSSETRLLKSSCKSKKKRRLAPTSVLSSVSAHISHYPHCLILNSLVNLLHLIISALRLSNNKRAVQESVSVKVVEVVTLVHTLTNII